MAEGQEFTPGDFTSLAELLAALRNQKIPIGHANFMKRPERPSDVVLKDKANQAFCPGRLPADHLNSYALTFQQIHREHGCFAGNTREVDEGSLKRALKDLEDAYRPLMI